VFNARGKPDIDWRIMAVATGMWVGFTGLFFWMLSLRVRLARVERRRSELASAGPESGRTR
jgi:hypothetical protein